MKRAASAGAVALVIGVASCGARSGLSDCWEDADCAAHDRCATLRCVARVCVVTAHTVCDDGDPCTDDRCDAKTGACVFDHETPDLDGDGHRAPKPGLAPGAAGACGDDCDDTDPAAFLGGVEVCDGVDNDCNGVVDDGARYVPGGKADVRLSTDADEYAESSGLARGSQDHSLAIYLGTRASQLEPYVVVVDDTGAALATPKVLGSMQAAAGSAGAVFTGDRYGVAWSDRRDGNYEVYFATFDPKGAKLPPGDIRVTVSDGFSIYPSIVWTGSEFIVAWQEELSNVSGWRLQAQRLGLDGRLDGEIATLTPSGTFEQAPVLASSRKELGVAWVRGDTAAQHVFFATFALADLSPASTPRDVSGSRGGRSPALAYAKDGYVAAWYTPEPRARTVFATVVGRDGAIAVAPMQVQGAGGGQSRDPALLSLGDRVLFVWADDRDGNQGFELYTRTLAADLSPLGPESRVTNAAGDSVEPVVAFGHHGSVSVLFRDDRLAAPAAFFTALSCLK